MSRKGSRVSTAESLCVCVLVAAAAAGLREPEASGGGGLERGPQGRER